MISVSQLMSLLILSNIFPISARSFSFRESTAQVEVVSAQQYDGLTTATFTSTALGLDTQHIHHINASSWEWYYFDAVAPDGLTYISVIMYTAPATGFFGGGPPNDIIVSSLFASIPENAEFYFNETPGTEAVITSCKNGASGQWKGTGFEFEGQPDLSEYEVRIDSPQISAKGRVEFKSVNSLPIGNILLLGCITYEIKIAPPHYPCGPMEAGQPLEVMPSIGWSGAIPDADAKVDMIINGTRIKFNGVGYHDKNWSNRPFLDLISSWYWGHVRLGPYSVVFWDGIDSTGKESTSAYVSRGGKIITTGCSGVKVRPSSEGAIYPPVVGGNDPTKYHVEIDMGSEGLLDFEMQMIQKVWSSDIYDRWTGIARGGIRGANLYSGVALWEQFVLPETY